MRSIRRAVLTALVLIGLVLSLSPAARAAGTYTGTVVGMDPATANVRVLAAGHVQANSGVQQFLAACRAGQAAAVANNNTGLPGGSTLVVDMKSAQTGTITASAPFVANIPGIDHPLPDLDLYLFDANCNLKNKFTPCPDCGPTSNEIDRLTGIFSDYEGISGERNESAAGNGARYAVAHVYDGVNTPVKVTW